MSSHSPSQKKYYLLTVTTLIIAMSGFIGFGFFHIGKFETTDEHFWKYDRIQKYYNGLHAGITEFNWKKTRINDKPGVSVALVSGTGLLFIDDPHTHRNDDAESATGYTRESGDTQKLYNIFHTERTQSLNIALRIPLLLFNGLVMVPLFFYLLLRIFNAPARGLFAREQRDPNQIYADSSRNTKMRTFFARMEEKKLIHVHPTQLATAQEKRTAIAKQDEKFAPEAQLILDDGGGQSFVPHFALLFIALNPLLIGISQIINPDALLWSFGLASILSYWALLRTGENYFITLTGVLMGFALLCKYSANLFFILFALLFVLSALYAHKDTIATQVRFYIISLGKIIVTAWSVFVILMPAVLHKPAHFLYGTMYSPPLAPLVDLPIAALHARQFFFLANGDYRTLPLALIAFVVFVTIVFVLPLVGIALIRVCKKYLRVLPSLFSLLVLIIIALSLYNAWTDASLLALDNIKETSRVSGEMLFPQITTGNAVWREVVILIAQSQNLIFSLHPLVLLGFIGLSLSAFFARKSAHSAFHFFVVITTMIFIGGAVVADVFVNVRYGLILYPLYAILAAIACGALCAKAQQFFAQKVPRTRQVIIGFFIVTLIATHLFTLIKIAPHYFNYASLLLPKKYVVTDAWGYGLYEAAHYLNTLPDAEKIVVWADRAGLCQFFVGKCIRSHEIDLTHTSVDYFVFSRRGILRKPFGTQGARDNLTLSPDVYYSDAVLNSPVWAIHIGGRPENFIKIIPVQNQSEG